MTDVSFELRDASGALDERIRTIVREEFERLEVKRDESWMDVEKAAKYLGCKRQRLYDLVYMNEIPHGKAGRRLLFRRSELDEWVRAGGK